MSARAKPFDFADFAGPARPEPAAAAPAPEPARPLASVEEARAEGLIEGRRLAMETIAADEAASLARIAAALEDAAAFLATARAQDQAEMLSVASHLLDEFCAGLAEKREIDAALDLLRRLTAHSDDRRATRLVLSRASRERLAPKIAAAIKGRRLDDFVTIESDPSLQPGEMRLEWRGGEARRTRREITEAVAAMVRTLRTAKEVK
jgi:flagellar biosynthesis/type III secretory pathway protein FliH